MSSPFRSAGFINAVKAWRNSQRAPVPDLLAESKTRAANATDTVPAACRAPEYQAYAPGGSALPRGEITPPPELIAFPPYRRHDCGAVMAVNAPACWHCEAGQDERNAA